MAKSLPTLFDNYTFKYTDRLIGAYRHFQLFFQLHHTTNSPSHVRRGFLTTVLHTTLSKQLDAFPHRLLVYGCKTNDICHSDFCQTLEIMLAQLAF